MDASEQVAIETGRPLIPGTYQALSVRFCTPDTVFIQIWTMVNGSAAQLKWQTSYTPSSAQNAPAFVTVSIATPIVITSNDRIGVFGVVSGSNWTKVSVPYDLDPINGAMYFTKTRFNTTAVFTAGLQVALDTVQWPRTFTSCVRLCIAANCSDLPAVTAPAQPTAAPQPVNCGCPTTCSPDAALTSNLQTQSSYVQYLAEQINKMNNMLLSLTSSTVQTGYCPSNMSPGTYGLGSCYVVVREAVELGMAAMMCESNYNGNLVSIDSSMEENYMYTILTNSSSVYSGPQSFWTAGMYSLSKYQWTWYYQDWTPRTPINANTYQDWINNNSPTPSTSQDICLILTVDVNAPNNQKKIYWQKGDCSTPLKYYVCEIPKICY